HLKGVVFLSAIHYMEGNIVCDLYLFKYSELTPQRREKLKLEDSSAYRDALVFLLESSYGVWLVAVFDTLLVERLPPSPKGTADTI
ncbi:MAG TPA: hypothetical protein VHM91_06345, partial [Verrucomicrobiales bacterium]|nr:hypothetical protein [Verrucomicrobiales bacterium]